jgi:predicted RNase H-like HicB family nuclease
VSGDPANSPSTPRTRGYTERMTSRTTFTIIVERDPESEWLVAEVVELPGCYSQAPDLPTLEANIREAITAYRAVNPDVQDAPGFVGTLRLEVAV